MVSYLACLGTDFWSLHCNPVLARQNIADYPFIDQRSYEVHRPELASIPVISDKRVQGTVSEAIVHFSDQVHIWWR